MCHGLHNPLLSTTSKGKPSPREDLQKQLTSLKTKKQWSRGLLTQQHNTVLTCKVLVKVGRSCTPGQPGTAAVPLFSRMKNEIISVIEVICSESMFLGYLGSFR